MRTHLTLIAAVTVLGGSTAWAGSNCTCRGADGVEATIGETVCLKTPSGQRLARCEMVLNNTSWKFLEGACPQASRATEGPVLAMSAAPGTPLSLR